MRHLRTRGERARFEHRRQRAAINAFEIPSARPCSVVRSAFAFSIKCRPLRSLSLRSGARQPACGVEYRLDACCQSCHCASASRPAMRVSFMPARTPAQ